MKIFVAFAVLIAGISAFPQLSSSIGYFNQIALRDERLVTDAIAGAIQDVSQSIKDAGLDPLYIQSESVSYALPVPVILSAAATVEELDFNGLSDIVINNINFGILTSRLRLDIELPKIAFSLKNGVGGAVFFGSELSASASGSLVISNVNVKADVRVNVGIITGISIRSLDVDFSLGGIQSDLTVKVQNYDLSSKLNIFLGTTIPATLNAFSAEINELLEIIIEDIANELL